MREIKFRAWDKIDNKMRIVTRMTFGLEPTGHPMILVHLDDGTENPVTRPIKDVDLLQYIGLKDRNRKEIYEGNVLLHHHRVKDYLAPPVKWRDDLEDTGQGTGICGYELNQECASDAEIIGNIYENPVLTQKEE